MTPDQMWTKGKLQSQKGENIVTAWQEKRSNGERNVREGETLITDGTNLIEQSRLDYQKLSDKVGESSKPNQVAYEADQFKRIAERWESGIEKIKDGKKLIKKGNKTIKSSQDEIFKGRELIESGSQLMINSQTTKSN